MKILKIDFITSDLINKNIIKTQNLNLRVLNFFIGILTYFNARYFSLGKQFILVKNNSVLL